MKRLISTALAAALAFGSLGVTAASAHNYYGPPGYNQQHGYVPPGYHIAPDGYNGWHRGGYYHGPRTVINNYGSYRLRPPPRGYEWVNNNGQFVLLAVTTGVIADILINR